MASCSFASWLPAPSFPPSPGEKPAVWLGEGIIPLPWLALFWGRPKQEELWLALEIIPCLCPGGGTTSFQSPSVFCRGKSWSRKEIELILDFPRDFLRFLSFSEQPHTALDRQDTFPVFPALGMRYSPVERTQCPENGKGQGSLFTGRSSWKQ